MKFYTTPIKHHFAVPTLTLVCLLFLGNTAGPGKGSADTITFTYNGQEVTYEVIVSPVTGRRWMDRNLGAPNSPSAYDDFLNYGDLFQWGRLADGHQLVKRLDEGLAVAVNDVVDSMSIDDTPGHGNFITPEMEGNSDWRNPSNDSLWQAADTVNNPCPEGWRIPTLEEWQAENLLGGLSQAYTQLKLTAGGYRANENGDFYANDSAGVYWSSTTLPVSIDNPSGAAAVGILKDPGISVAYIPKVRSVAHSVRCISQ